MAGRLIDWTDCELRLVVHGETPTGKAWVVSRDGGSRTETIPKALSDVGEVVGHVVNPKRRDWREPRFLAVRLVAIPRFIAAEKGFV